MESVNVKLGWVEAIPNGAVRKSMSTSRDAETSGLAMDLLPVFFMFFCKSSTCHICGHSGRKPRADKRPRADAGCSSVVHLLFCHEESDVAASNQTLKQDSCQKPGQSKFINCGMFERLVRNNFNWPTKKGKRASMLQSWRSLGSALGNCHA